MIIIFESHATTIDNEAQLAAGWFDVALSQLGTEQARQMGRRYKDETFDAIFCSDLQRSYNTAQIAFGDKFPIIQDARLRECNYGELNRAPKAQIEAQKIERLTQPFPNGESYEDTSRRMKSFLEDVAKDYSNKKILIIGHSATQYGLEHWINKVPLQEIVTAPWQWQPGWEYQLAAIQP